MKDSIFMDDEEFVTQWENAETGSFPLFVGVNLHQYTYLKVYLYRTFGGRIPVLFMTNRAEFEKLIRQIFYKGQDRAIPPSLGGMAINGWKSIDGTRHKALLLSDGYYSAVPPEAMNLTPEEWKEKSFLVRRAHECTHYYTLRAFGFMNNSLKDELIADAIGLIEAFGCYEASRFFWFMGMENYPDYREGGRLKNYLPKDNTDSDFFVGTQASLYRAARELEAYIKANPQFLQGDEGKLALIKALAALDEDKLFGGDFTRYITI